MWIWELDHKESWMPKNQYFQIVVLEKTLESLLDSKYTKPVIPKENQHWIFTGRIDTEVEVPIFWPPDVKSNLLEKTLMLGKIEGRGRRERQDEMVGWHHQLNGHEFEQVLGDGEGQGSLVCCSPWGLRVRHDLTTEKQDNNQWSRGYFIHGHIRWYSFYTVLALWE